MKVTRLDPWQKEALDAVRDHDRVTIRSGHGVGKSAFLSWLILWFLGTRFPARIGCTAPTSHQLSDVLWGELAKWHRRMDPEFKGMYRITSDMVEFTYGPKESYAVARTARRETPEAFQGLHSENMLFIADEASGIDDIIFQVGEGAMSTEGAKTVLTGNPTRTSGYFYDSHNKMKDMWCRLKVGCEDSKNVAPAYFKMMAKKYGLDSNVYRVRVLGDFPKDDDDSVIPLSLIEEAVIRKVEPTQVRPIWGLDIARFGSARSALCERIGNSMPEKVQSWRGKDLMQTAGIVYNLWEKRKDENRPVSINVDCIGIGAGVADRLREMGLPAIDVNVGEAPSIESHYNRLRDELWFRAREWFDKRNVSMCQDEDLIDELTSPKYKYTSLGKLQVESKEEMIKRGVASPDLADAFCLTFAYALGAHSGQKLVYPNLGVV